MRVVFKAFKYLPAACWNFPFFRLRRLARENPKEYMSIITDGMAQVHCELP